MYIFNVQQLENVVDTYASLDIRHFGVHHEAGELAVACREAEEIGIAALEWIVLVGQCSPQGADTEHFSPFQILDQRNAVEQLSVHVIRKGHGCITVVQELHIVDQGECFTLSDI